MILFQEEHATCVRPTQRTRNDYQVGIIESGSIDPTAGAKNDTRMTRNVSSVRSRVLVLERRDCLGDRAGGHDDGDHSSDRQESGCSHDKLGSGEARTPSDDSGPEAGRPERTNSSGNCPKSRRGEKYHRDVPVLFNSFRTISSSFFMCPFGSAPPDTYAIRPSVPMMKSVG